jgi:hypothetical protein
MKRKENRTAPSLRKVLDRLRRFFMPWIEPTEPEDPYAYRMATVRRPPNKSGAAAVAELNEEELEEK